MIKLVILFFSALTCTWAFTCQKNVPEYNWPDSTNCRYYHNCNNGILTDHSCFIIFRRFNPEKLACDWTWKVNCTAIPKLPFANLPKQPDSDVKPSEPSKENSKPVEENPKTVPSDKKPSEQNNKPSKENSKPVEENPKTVPSDKKPSEQNNKPSKENSKPVEENPKTVPNDKKPSEQSNKPSKEDKEPVEENAKPVPSDAKPSPES